MNKELIQPRTQRKSFEFKFEFEGEDKTLELFSSLNPFVDVFSVVSPFVEVEREVDEVFVCVACVVCVVVLLPLDTGDGIVPFVDDDGLVSVRADVDVDVDVDAIRLEEEGLFIVEGALEETLSVLLNAEVDFTLLTQCNGFNEVEINKMNKIK